jgi:hypothetical protein
MKKEVIIAIVLGFALGLVITFGIWTANRAIQEKAKTPTPPTNAPTPQEETPTPTTPELPLTISEPADNTISSKEKITLSGSTSPEAIVVIFDEENEKIIEADKEGQFESEITLTGGPNRITIKAFDDSGNEAEASLNIIYSTAKI